MADEPNSLEIDVVTRLSDYAAFYRHIYRRPSRLLRQVVATIVSIAWYEAAVLVHGAVDASLGNDLRFDAAGLEDFVETGLVPSVIASLPIIAVVLVALLLLNILVLQPLQTRIAVRRQLLARPEIDKKDRQLTHGNHCRFDEYGYTWSMPDSRTALSWAYLKRIDETRRHLFMMSSDWGGVIFPKRNIDAALLDRIRTFARTRLASARGGA